MFLSASFLLKPFDYSTCDEEPAAIKPGTAWITYTHHRQIISGARRVNTADSEGKLITATLLHFIGDCITHTLSFE